MSKKLVTAADFLQMVQAGAKHLQARADQINALNVFPVPDGDTGTNMSLTLTSGVQAMEAKFTDHLGKVAEALSKGLLMGARGNSGVILSQLFRGFAKSVDGLKEADSRQLAEALQQGVNAAYQAVVKPVEGTMLTVSREAARRALAAAGKLIVPLALMREVTEAARLALARTPEQLPILKQVGVVDAGGQGLVYLYEGFVQALGGVSSGEAAGVAVPGAAAASHPFAGGHGGTPSASAPAQLSADTIEFGYCTEFIICLDEKGRSDFQEQAFREELGKLGDSIVVVADDDLVKVHIHSETPGTVMNRAMRFGELSQIKIENMREQHAHIVDGNDAVFAGGGPETRTKQGDGPVPDRIAGALSDSGEPMSGEAETGDQPMKRYGIVVVAAGDGIEQIFRSLGADEVIAGGQTMNPSTEDIMSAVVRIRAETVYILPNNSNIILAAEQAKALADKRVYVIGSKTIQQGLAAMLAFREDAGPDDNARDMGEATDRVKSGSVTFAVRDSQIGGMNIRQGDYIGMVDHDIVVSGPHLPDVCTRLLDRMVNSGDEIVTLLEGLDADSALTEGLLDHLNRNYPDLEIENHRGGQPLYYYLVSVE